MYWLNVCSIPSWWYITFLKSLFPNYLAFRLFTILDIKSKSKMSILTNAFPSKFIFLAKIFREHFNGDIILKYVYIFIDFSILIYMGLDVWCFLLILSPLIFYCSSHFSRKKCSGVWVKCSPGTHSGESKLFKFSSVTAIPL